MLLELRNNAALINRMFQSLGTEIALNCGNISAARFSLFQTQPYRSKCGALLAWQHEKTKHQLTPYHLLATTYHLIPNTQ